MTVNISVTWERSDSYVAIDFCPSGAYGALECKASIPIAQSARLEHVSFIVNRDQSRGFLQLVFLAFN